MLERIGEVISARGYAGDVRPAQIAYVAITSRLLERPMNVAFIAPSAAGKNTAVDAARDLVPSEAVYLIRAASQKAAIYSAADFCHRIVFFSEADSIPEDGPAGSAIRSLAADNMLAYEVVEQNQQTGKFETRRIEKPGPTGLITTSTRSLGPQMATRTLEVSLADDDEQTRAVMRAQARGVAGTSGQAVDVAELLAFQEWLDKCGERRVVVPFAGILAELVPSSAVRMRRDFRQLLTATQAIALLYQSQRQRTHDGAIIATVEDYGRARQLLAPVFEATTAEGLTPAVRQTVASVGTGERDVSQGDLVKRLNLSKATVSWRVNQAVTGGWLVNDEWHQGRPARLRRGAPLPDESTALPPVDCVRQAFESKPGSNHDSNGDAPKAAPKVAGHVTPFERSNDIADRSGTAERLATEILDAIRSGEIVEETDFAVTRGLRTADLRRRFGGNKPPKQITAALTLLAERQQAQKRRRTEFNQDPGETHGTRNVMEWWTVTEWSAEKTLATLGHTVY